MTRKDYIAIANIIAGLNMSAFERRQCAQQFADVLARTNPRFDCSRFLKACGFGAEGDQ